METRKHVATTLREIANNSTVKMIFNKTVDITEIIEIVDGFWQYNLLERKPSPVEIDDAGNLTTTNLDLSTFLYSLIDRDAKIVIPKYKCKRPRSVQEDIQVISTENRIGRIVGLVSNRETFSFGIRIIDENVVSKDGEYGFPRTFTVVSNGKWYDGFKSLRFISDVNENRFITENKLYTGNHIYFSNFVTPEKWISYYGQYYFITKCCISRLLHEVSFLQMVKEELLGRGIPEPKLSFAGKANWPHQDFTRKKISKEKGQSVKVDAFESKVYLPIPKFEHNVYPSFDTNDEGMLKVCRKIKLIKRHLEKFRFAVRCVEFAAFNKNFECFPAWIQNVKWEDFKESPRSRKKWKRLKIQQPGVGEHSISIIRRQYQVSDIIRNDDEETE